MADDVKSDFEKHLSSELDATGMTPAEGVEAFARILAAPDLGQVVVSPTDFHAYLEQYEKVKLLLEDASAKKERYPRPNLQNPYVPPRSDTEKLFATIWQDTLGIESVGIHDNIFELGADSLLGIQIVKRIKEETGKDMPVVYLFNYPTVALLAEASDREGEEELEYEGVALAHKQRQRRKNKRTQRNRENLQ